VAARTGDSAGFERQFAAMTRYFQATKNPCLLQQCDALRAEAVRLGLPGSAAGEEPRSHELYGETAIVTCAEARPTVVEGTGTGPTALEDAG
jgi:hypothetical protein